MPTGCEDRLPWSENKPGEPLEKGKHPYGELLKIIKMSINVNNGFCSCICYTSRDTRCNTER